MNEVKLTDFDAETLSLASDAINAEIKYLEDVIALRKSDWKFREVYQDKIEKLLAFKVQVLYSFSLVNEREKSLSN